ncbi:MFS transporter [Thalassococcus sp. BH17M4-6]|uniref:MFS transporter n=1 Tax=Thalassococcus sp. BH17M4-6 TaxID=3413148 RepID=UPI003BBF4CB0
MTSSAPTAERRIAGSRIALMSVFLSRLAQFATFPFIYSFVVGSGASPVLAGVVVALSAITSALVGLGGGVLADRRCEVAVIGLCNLALATLLLLLQISFAVHVLILFSALFGAIQGCLDPATQLSLAKQRTTYESRRSFGARYYVINLAAAIGPVLGALIFEHAQIWPVFAISALLVGVAGLSLPHRADTPPPGPARAAPLHDILAALRHYRGGILSVTLIMVAYAQMTTTFSHHIITSLGYGIEFYAGLMVFHAGLILFGQPLVLNLLARAQFVQTITLGLLALGLGLLLPALASGPHGRAVLVAAMFCFTVGEVLVLPSSNALFAELSPQDTKALALSLYNLSRLGLAAGPILGSVIVETLGFPALCALSALAAAGGTMGLVRMSRREETASG